MKITVNAILHIGAVPVMEHTIEEIEEKIRIASALGSKRFQLNFIDILY
jgi:hydroxyethylthiazole kinase-like sugar kinase family protein